MKSHIASIAGYAPATVLTNDELAKRVDTSDEWIFSHTGIKNRHIAAPEQAASDLGIEAGRLAIQRAVAEGKLEPNDIDLVICATSTPDFLSFPATASIIQDKLELPRAGAFDITAACTGFIYGIETAKAYIDSGMAETVLVVGTEIYSRIVNWQDRSSCVLFGDGAGAAVLTAAKDNHGTVGKGYLRSRGSGAAHLLRPAGGSRTNYVPGTNPESDLYVSMNGRQVYLFAVQAIIETIQELCTRNNVKFDDIDWVIPHQANRRIIEAACERAGWNPEKFFLNMDEYANTSAASIPLAAEDLIKQKRLIRGQKILTVGFGAGLSYGGNYFVY